MNAQIQSRLQSKSGKQIHPDWIAKAKAWNAEQDRKVLELARSINPLAAEVLEAIYSDDAQKMLDVLTPKVGDNVYFLTDNLEGTGKILRIVGEEVTLFYNEKLVKTTLDLISK